MSRALRIVQRAQTDVDDIFNWLAARSVSGAVSWYALSSTPLNKSEPRRRVMHKRRNRRCSGANFDKHFSKRAAAGVIASYFKWTKSKSSYSESAGRGRRRYAGEISLRNEIKRSRSTRLPHFVDATALAA
jgi:hypothetical protein